MNFLLFLCHIIKKITFDNYICVRDQESGNHVKSYTPEIMPAFNHIELLYNIYHST